MLTLRTLLDQHRSISNLEFGGPGSGCNPAVGECGRQPGEDSSIPGIMEKQVATKAPYMRLWLKTGATPYLFPNDGTTVWNLNKETGILHVEQVESDVNDHPAEFNQKQVFDIPVKNIRQWTSAFGQNQSHFGWPGNTRTITPIAKVKAAGLLPYMRRTKGKQK